ncbi:glycine oxidase [Abditibacteriota bacterium]|nr:glycine oxidase [Abditibacteriota bacterium]
MIAVIGGGLIGSCVAFELNQAGEDVLVFDADLPGAAWRAGAGLLTPSGERLNGTPLEADARQSLSLWPDFVRRLEAASGQSVGFRFGVYRVALNDSEANTLNADTDGELSQPPLPHLRAARFHANEGCVHPPSVRSAALSGLQVERANVEHIEPTDSGVEIETDAGIFSAQFAILCCGAWSSKFGLSVRAVQGQALLLDADSNTPSLYGLPQSGASQYALGRPDGLYVGATVRDTTTIETSPDAEATRALRQKAYRLLGVQTASAPLIKQLVGFRPTTPDGIPFIGPHHELANVLVATGHSRHGVLLAPLTAQRVLQQVQEMKQEHRNAFKVAA